MEVIKVLRLLERNTGVFPRKAVEAAMEMRDKMTPELLRILEDTVERADEIVREDQGGAYLAHLYAMFLLAQFRETRAYPLAVRFARLEVRLLDALAGDFVTEGLCRVLASVCDGDTRPIEELIEDGEVGEYARSAALNSLLVLVAEDAKSRDEVMAYFKYLFEGGLQRSYSHAWDSLVACATRLHPEEVSEHITAAFEEGLVDGCLSRLGMSREREKGRSPGRLRKVGITISERVDEMGGRVGTATKLRPARSPSR